MAEQRLWRHQKLRFFKFTASSTVQLFAGERDRRFSQEEAAVQFYGVESCLQGRSHGGNNPIYSPPTAPIVIMA
jgi:hypothetical protein